MAQSNELRVFISSTFRDLQEEREHLVKKIFPEIRALCRQRGITFTEVDLRWGLTEEQATLGTVIRTCLEEVDKCRPYFIGLLGSRYGWIPDLHEVMIDPDLLAKYPWVEEAAINGTSLTEMEFIHGVFNAADGRADYDYFYHRPQQTAGGDDPEKLRALLERVRQGGYPLREFSDAEELGLLVHDDLLGMIDRYWPEDHLPSGLEIERRSHAAFSGSRRRAYIPNPEHLKEFNAWIAEEATPLVISAESGLGKSALSAYLTQTYRVKHPDAVIIEHYVGASEQSGSALSLVRHVIEEICERFGITEELPTDPQKLLEAFPNWLWRLGHLASDLGQEVLVVLDALNQLDEAGRRLTWLPPTAPEDLRLLVTVTPGDALDMLRNRGWQELQLAPIEDERVRQSIVLRYLGEFHKGIAPDQLRRITSDTKAHSPLYLRVVAEELRLHGEHETLPEVIEHYVTAENLDEVFQQVLERMERDYGGGTVREMLSLVWCSRSGLSETEVLELTGTSRLELSRLLFALDYHLLHRDGLLGFFHDYLRRAVEKRYLSDEQKKRQTYEQLAGYFEGVEVTLRATRELLHALEALGERERLESVLSQIYRFKDLWKSEGNEVLRLWAAIEPTKVAVAYRAGLDRWQAMVGEQDRGSVLGMVAWLLEAVGAWREAQELQGERLLLAREQGDRAVEAAARNRLGWLLQLLGEYEEGFKELSHARDLYDELGDRSGLSYAIGGMGGVHANRGEFDRALECLRQQESICRDLGDRRGVAGSLGTMGNVYYDRSEIERALECYQQTETIYRELGDRGGLAGSLHNIGRVYQTQRKHTEAVEHYKEALEINRSIGNRQWMAFNLGNMGIVCEDLGEYEESLEYYRQAETILRELGDRRGVAAAIHNTGLVYQSQGKPREAMERYKEALEINRSIGNRHWMANNLGSMGIMYSSFGEYAEALECLRQQEAISRDLGEPLGLVNSIGNLGNLYSNLGEYDRALECFRQTDEICRKMGDSINVAGAIGNMGGVYSNRGEYAEALECYRKAAEEHRALGFRPSLSEWLLGTAGVLVALGETDSKEMPEYLVKYVPGVERATWRAMSLQYARTNAEECVAISREISKPDTIFSGRVLLARISSAEGDIVAGIVALEKMLAETMDDPDRADVQYWLWKLRVVGDDHRSEALRLYQSLVEKTPKYTYRKRIDELSAGN